MALDNVAANDGASFFAENGQNRLKRGAASAKINASSLYRKNGRAASVDGKFFGGFVEKNPQTFDGDGGARNILKGKDFR